MPRGLCRVSQCHISRLTSLVLEHEGLVVLCHRQGPVRAISVVLGAFFAAAATQGPCQARHFAIVKAWELAASKGTVIAADKLGKWKTALQMVAIPLSLYGGTIAGFDCITVGYYGIWLSVVLSLLSGAQYIFQFLKK